MQYAVWLCRDHPCAHQQQVQCMWRGTAHLLNELLHLAAANLLLNSWNASLLREMKTWYVYSRYQLLSPGQLAYCLHNLQSLLHYLLSVGAVCRILWHSLEHGQHFSVQSTQHLRGWRGAAHSMHDVILQELLAVYGGLPLWHSARRPDQ